MRSGSLVCACLLVAGCDRVLGLGEVHIGVDGAVPRHITIDYTKRVYASNAAGPTVTDDLVDPSAVIVRSASGARLDVQHPGVGQYAFDTFEASYEVQVVLSQSPFSYRVDHTADALHLLDSATGRADDAPAPKGTTISLANVSGPSVAPAEVLFAMGGYGAASSGATAFDWSGNPLLDASKGDHLYDLQYVGDPATGAAVIGAYAELPATLHAGANVPAGKRMVPSYGTCHVKADITALADAMQKAAPSYSLSGTSWDLYAIPSTGAAVDVDATSLLHLASKGTGPPAQPAVDTDQMCFDPIAGTSIAVEMMAVFTRSMLAPSATTPLTVGYSARVFSPGVASSGGSGEVRADQLGLPENLTLAGVPLVQDALAIAPAPGEPVVLAWTQNGPADYYTAYLTELVASSVGTSELVYVDSVYSTRPSVTFPAEDLRVGHFYVVLLNAFVGAPMAASGDFRARGEPVGTLVETTPYFFIAPM